MEAACSLETGDFPPDYTAW